MNEKKPVLKLKNKCLVALDNWLARLQLGGRESRERSRFRALLRERIEEIGKVRKEIMTKYAKKNKDGSLKTKKEKIILPNGSTTEREVVDFGNEKNQEKAMKEYEEYLEEELVIDILEGNKSKIYTVRDLVLNTDEKFSGIMADMYDLWCTAFEQLPDRREI